jgi:hypothetical protein
MGRMGETEEGGSGQRIETDVRLGEGVGRGGSREAAETVGN